MGDRLDRVLALVRTHRPRLALVPKDEVAWWRWLGRVAPAAQHGFVTVLGDTVYLPDRIERFDRDVLAAILAHELVHQLDQARWGALFYLSYGLPPAWRTWRAHWERRAYAVDLLLAWEAGGEAGLRRQLDQCVALFGGAAYGWMWGGPHAARHYLEPVVAQVRSGQLAREAPYDAILRAWRGPDGSEATPG